MLLPSRFDRVLLCFKSLGRERERGIWALRSCSGIPRILQGTRELVVELLPSSEEMTIDKGAAEISRIEGMAFETGGAGALVCIALGRDE